MTKPERRNSPPAPPLSERQIIVLLCLRRGRRVVSSDIPSQTLTALLRHQRIRRVGYNYYTLTRAGDDALKDAGHA